MTINDYMQKIEQDCKPFLDYIERYAECVPYRGMTPVNDCFIRKDVHKARYPRDTPIPVHIALDQSFDRVGTTTRSNSVFATGKYRLADQYGSVYRIIPIGDFKYLWSPHVVDMTDQLDRFFNSGMLEQIIDDDVILTDDHIHHMFTPFPSTEDHDPSRGITMLLKDYILKYRATVAYNRLQDDCFSVVNHSFDDYVWKNFQNHDWTKAIKTGNEIMIECDAYYAVACPIFEKMEIFNHSYY